MGSCFVVAASCDVVGSWLRLSKGEEGWTEG